MGLTLNGWKHSVSKETVPLLPWMDLPASLRHHSSPVPDGARQIQCWGNIRVATYFIISSPAAKIFPTAVLCGDWLPYLMPLLMVSVGEQVTVSTQSGQWYCLLSKNQPESDRPRTCIPVCPRPSRSSATRSTFSRTPVPPALHTHTDTHILNEISTSSANLYRNVDEM